MTVSLGFWLGLAASAFGAVQAADWGTAFTYQGRLTDRGQPADGLYDLRFGLYDAESGGNRIAGFVTNENVAVTGGLFTTAIDFGPWPTAGTGRWLGLAVRPGEGAAVFTLLEPRQRVFPVPFAMSAESATRAATAATADAVPWSGLTGVPAGFADGADHDTKYTAGPGLELKGTQFGVLPRGLSNTFLADGAVTSDKLASNSVTLPKIPDGLITPAKLNLSSFSNAFWKLEGNTSTVPGTHFVGTLDNRALELKVNRNRAVRIEPHAEAPAFVGGSSNNVASNVAGAFIAGGRNHLIRTGASHSIVLGGASNVVGAPLALAGGYRATTTNRGTFVWADANPFDFASTQTNQFRVRAVGGAEFVTALGAAGEPSASVALSATGGVSTAARTDTNAALELRRGFLRVAGAGTRPEAPVFVHRLAPTNRFINCTVLDHPLCNGDPGAILFVTPNENPNDPRGTDQLHHMALISVFYTGTNRSFSPALQRRWAIGYPNAILPPDGVAYNVLVIKP